MDNLSLCMIQCKKDGFGVHYGAWRAAKGPLPVAEKKIPAGLRPCQYCGDPFKPLTKNHKYCGAYCQNRASLERCKNRKKEGANND